MRDNPEKLAVIAARATERESLTAAWQRAKDQGDLIAIDAAQAARVRAQAAHMDALAAMFPAEALMAQESAPLWESQAMPGAYRRALARLASEFAKRFRLMLRELGAFDSSHGRGYLDLWKDESANPWRRFAVRQIIVEVIDEINSNEGIRPVAIKQPSLEAHLTTVRNRAFIDFMTTRQVTELVANGKFVAKAAIKVFVERAEYRGATVTNLEQVWARWEREHPLEQYGSTDTLPRKRGQKAANTDETYVEPGKIEPFSKVMIDDFTPFAEARAMRIVRSKLAELRSHPAREEMRIVQLLRSSSGGWQFDPTMAAGFVLRQGTYKTDGAELRIDALETDLRAEAARQQGNGKSIGGRTLSEWATREGDIFVPTFLWALVDPDNFGGDDFLGYLLIDQVALADLRNHNLVSKLSDPRISRALSRVPLPGA